LKQIIVPRLELATATFSAKRVNFVANNCLARTLRSIFGQTVKLSLANRVQPIRTRTLSTGVNPADHASRGLTASQLLQGNDWLT